MGLSANIVDVLNSMGFENPTPIQEKSIPLLLSKNPTDFIGLAQTGTGKTAAFGLPLIDLIDADVGATQAIVMAPTRELSQQTASELVKFSKNSPVNVEVVYGGANISSQIKALKKPTQIVVATPGRLIDLINRKAVKLDSVEYVVLDEADEMLNMGFKEEIDEILSHTPDFRVTWLFSATMPPEIRKISNRYMAKPEEIAVNSKAQANTDIVHKFVITKSANKLPAVRRFLDIHPDMRGIMFCRTKRETQDIADRLGNMNYGVEALHGDLSQAQRNMVMKRFKTRSMQLLIATDVAARGIDVSELTHVMHHTLPDQLESYTHRSGRTGRAGKKGISLAFINPREGRRITELERKIKIKFERIEVPTKLELRFSRMHNWANLIVNTQVDEQSNEILEDLKSKFDGLSKEDILKRLITTQLDHLMFQDGEDDNLNETHGDNQASRDKGKFHRYFINVGKIDGMSKGDLLHFLSDISSVDRKYFGDIKMLNNCSYFDVDKGHDQGLISKFEGISIEERSIRVNRDEDNTGSSKRPDGRKKRPRRNYSSGAPFRGKGRRRR